MRFPVKLVFLILVVLANLIPIIWYAKYWWSNVRIPSSWITYNNTKGYHYSFAYPKEWVLTECGNGEAVVAKKAVEQCLRPLEASEGYLDNLYFQVFLPKYNYEVNTKNFRQFVLPDKLKGWTTVSWYWKEEWSMLGLNDVYAPIGTASIPVKPTDTLSYILYSERNRHRYYVTGEEKRALASPAYRFSIGFIPKPSSTKELERVVESVRFY
jgi:hypothetical protein